VIQNPFHVVSVGWDAQLIAGLLDRVEATTGQQFSHIVLTPADRGSLDDRPGRTRFYYVREDVRAALPQADRALLGSLERPGVPTINNMILSDRAVRHLDHGESLKYATCLARRLTELLDKLAPSVVIGGFDGLHGAIGFAVARKLGIPWVAMHFSTIPKGLSCFCSGLTPDTDISLTEPPIGQLRALAETTLRHFEDKTLAVPAYSSANNIGMVLERLPGHAKALATAAANALTGRTDRYRAYPVSRLCQEYVRKRANLLTLPRNWFLEQPPRTPYIFFGLHFQPESSIDVWAPFFSDQFNVIEQIARSTPSTHQLLIKLHKSDADNYSRRQLNRLRRIPGVQLVSPFASARAFIEGASVTVSIQGTIGLEAAMLGKPVLMFGDSRVLKLPSASKVGVITELPNQIRTKLRESPPDRDAIVRGLMSYLKSFSPGCYNIWDVLPSNEEIEWLAGQFRNLELFLENQERPAHRGMRLD
jgi:hypothetical protein